MFDDMSHQIELCIMIITAFIAFISSGFWAHWATCSVLAFCALVIDMLFFSENTFIYDPDYYHWKDLSEPREFQFKTD